MVECERRQADHGLDIARGALHGLRIAIPLWSAFAIAVVFVRDGPTTETGSLVLMIAAVATTILARPFLRALWARRCPEIRRRLVVEFRRMHPPLPLARQTFALSALTGTYLLFYFLDVNLQIVSLNSVTVFLPVSSMT